jgi:hypothetical protein
MPQPKIVCKAQGVHGELFRLACSIEICATRMAMHPRTLIVSGLRSAFDPTEPAKRSA